VSKHTYGYAYILKEINVFVLQLGCEGNYFERIFYYNVGNKPLQRKDSYCGSVQICIRGLYPSFILATDHVLEVLAVQAQIS
jgi:hypothetical protein